MRVDSSDIEGVLLFVPQPFRDQRGFFTRTFDTEIFDAHVAGTEVSSTSFTQDSQSRSVRGTIRGMHGRLGRGEAKLVRCAHGAVLDVIVDARPGSPTFGEVRTFRLDDDTHAHLYIPPGLLHGFQALTETADVCYRIDRPHDPSEDIGVAYDDATLAIEWPLEPTAVSDRDRTAGTWKDAVERL
ncbi:dTDP-4-keto-6-deoxy-D-glucose epimerase [Rhodococcus sp. Eu-32]|uniref:dTDP-4-dehydrorhamnose 3,5-epimerase n=1 Tax=Rhodococcoides kyotonense TaxID=398843 RepID=A0A177YHN5_9NOCA|nr:MULTISPECIES: dTDP-4-dehydrorhamnose 3,5-epimerase [Rhodococcus]OAK54739.1 dTDP-4-dehydrorhamnose 3,5-epimerase [Rhodococcus kyotonensis]RRQ29108.1 dTDP-4-keto-6-deoxy-D-glucose epimerase [Rhodococcus sp. Eu-32]